MTENLVSGKKYRILIDEANDIWDRISFWTKAADVYYNDNTSAEANKPVNMLKRSSAYTVGTIAYVAEAPSWVMLKCTTAGTTAATVPSTYSTISSVGTVITDGTAKFTVYDARPSATLSSSSFQVPAMSLVNSLDEELSANGNKFYFDYQDSKYGYNTSADRSSSTFVPFGGTQEIKFIGNVSQSSNPYNVNVSSLLPNYQSLTKDNFFYVCTNGRGASGGSSQASFNTAITYNASTGAVSLTHSKPGSLADGYCYTAGRLYYSAEPLPTT